MGPGEDEAGLVGQHDCLDTVAEAEFGQHAADVRLDGGLAEVELGGDLGIGEAPGEAEQYVALPVGEVTEHVRRRGGSRPPNELGQQSAGDRGRDERVADGLGTVTVVSAPQTPGDNWSAGQVLGGATLVPVSFTYRITDTTLGVVLNVDTVDHGAAHAHQSTITCSQSDTVPLADLLPVPPGVELPAGAAPTDVVQMSFIVSAVRVGSDR